MGGGVDGFSPGQRAADYELPPWVGSWKLGPQTDAATIKREARAEWAAALGRNPR